MGCISKERWRSYFKSSIFSIANHRHISPKQIEQLKLQIRIKGGFWRRAQKTTRIGTYSCHMHSRGIDINSIIHRSHLLFVGVWNGGNSSHWNGYSFTKDSVGEWYPRSWLATKSIWSVVHDGWEEAQSLVSRPRLPKETQKSFWQ